MATKKEKLIEELKKCIATYDEAIDACNHAEKKLLPFVDICHGSSKEALKTCVQEAIDDFFRR